MRTRLTRLSVAAAVVLAVAATGSGTAQAAEPVVVGSCATSVQGAPGTPVSLSPGAVVQPVTDLIRAIPLLGPPLAEPFRTAFNALPPIPIGAIPTGSGVITGGHIANQVNAELNKIPLLGPVITTLTGRVQETLTKLCGVTVTGVNAAAAPVQDGSKAVADTSQQVVGQVLPGAQPGQPGTGQPGTGQPGGGQPGTPPSEGQQNGGFTPVGGVGGLDLPLYGSNPFSGNFGRVPLFSYGSLPFAMPGQFSPSPGVRYGGNVSGYRPGYGLPTPSNDGVQTAGRAQALPGGGKLGGGVAAPVLLAVLMVSFVTGALVRTWVLRRAVA
ncbi:hypothetical protein ACQPW3_41905 [Actinosynnema sp. CA-248983]